MKLLDQKRNSSDGHEGIHSKANRVSFTLSLSALRHALKQHASPSKAKVLSSFFKTGPGQYGHGDQFLGITIPQQRLIAKQFSALLLKDISLLLKSPIHEERLTVLLILVNQFKKSNVSSRQRIADFYIKNLKRVNNWDLVDLTASNILGAFLYERGQGIDVLLRLVKSKNLWERRIAMVATLYFIRKKSAREALIIAEMLLNDSHDLMHKAVGWMLREVGKHVSRDVLQDFLSQHYKTMPRTALRYAIEHFPEKQRQAYLRGEV